MPEVDQLLSFNQRLEIVFRIAPERAIEMNVNARGADAVPAAPNLRDTRLASHLRHAHRFSRRVRPETDPDDVVLLVVERGAVLVPRRVFKNIDRGNVRLNEPRGVVGQSEPVDVFD